LKIAPNNKLVGHAKPRDRLGIEPRLIVHPILQRARRWPRFWFLRLVGFHGET